MNRYNILILFILAITSMAGCVATKAQPQMAPVQEFSNTVSITLKSKLPEYELERVSRGAVEFLASVHNSSDDVITLAHPSLCFPAHYQPGETKHMQDNYGKSEILLEIKRPDGEVVILRDGPHFFDADTPDSLTIPPAQSKAFHIGWFFLNARGRWENDAKAATVFLKKGQYKVRLLYRNLLAKAVSIDLVTGKSRFIQAWRGEILSNEVIIAIK